MAERDQGWYEQAARQENDWVRARILKKEHATHPEQPGPLAERAARMAKDNLGERHVAYGIALLNLGIFHEFVEGDAGKAEEWFARARDVLGEDHEEIGTAMYWLGRFLNQEKKDFGRAAAYLERAGALLKDPEARMQAQLQLALVRHDEQQGA